MKKFFKSIFTAIKDLFVHVAGDVLPGVGLIIHGTESLIDADETNDTQGIKDVVQGVILFIENAKHLKGDDIKNAALQDIISQLKTAGVQLNETV